MRVGSVVAAVVRIAIVAFCALIGAGLWVYAVIGFQESTLLGRFWSGMCLSGICLLFGAWVWGFWKWAVFIAPKSFRWANWVWDRLFALSFFGLIIKIMLWPYIHIAPIMLFSVPLSMLSVLPMVLAENSDKFYIAIPLFAVSSVICVVEILWDLCRTLGRKRASGK